MQGTQSAFSVQSKSVMVPTKDAVGIQTKNHVKKTVVVTVNGVIFYIKQI